MGPESPFPLCSPVQKYAGAWKTRRTTSNREEAKQDVLYRQAADE
jgi:hypothetical protein